jgi:hypothetical protein
MLCQLNCSSAPLFGVRDEQNNDRISVTNLLLDFAEPHEPVSSERKELRSGGGTA